MPTNPEMKSRSGLEVSGASWFFICGSPARQITRPESDVQIRQPTRPPWVNGNTFPSHSRGKERQPVPISLHDSHNNLFQRCRRKKRSSWPSLRIVHNTQQRCLC